ncbi:hypothetical protein I302_104531 [Kwoniella bestiolae CBS 10118]|uniref:Uncharacterized protein n=1 Tax=Kwoniella bestiolae CBS 10118 TaxID=1296100 RepID=A0A1B9GBI2_9TREE|nr:hypothetical protein I302_03237 [Kwoniella bestiolae CBS 10118]OCF28378.1 hypothetical protein I302_03237 [Kwoniella bestiolae CBS 10118]
MPVSDVDVDIEISPPLPLPINFELLPTLSPGKTLCPVFYVLIDTIPIYLTLDPSHVPHLSLFPLFLTLHPISPLSILSTLHLRPNEDYSLTLKGIAPFMDIWVPLSLARTICESLKVERLFWDEMDPTKGLLSKIMGEVQSWDDGLAIGHNWLPPSTQLPKSAYSLSTLLSTPLTGMDIIQDNRYITTPLDGDTRTRLIETAETTDPSKLRAGTWHEAWDGVIALSDLAWNKFLLYPSIPPIPDKPSHIPFLHPTESSILHTILPLIPSLISSESSLPTYPFNFDDLQILLHSKPLPAPRQSVYSIVSSLTSSKKDTNRLEKLEENEYKARLKICVAEFVGGILVSAFLAHLRPTGGYEERGRMGEGGRRRSSDKGVYVFVEKSEDFHEIDQHHLESTHTGHQSGKRGRSGSQNKSQHKEKDKTRNKGKGTENWMKTIESLETKRGSSPPPARESSQRLQQQPEGSPEGRPRQHSKTRSHSHSHTSKAPEQRHTSPPPPHLGDNTSSESDTTATPPHYRVIQSIDQFPLGDWSWNNSSKSMLSENKDGWQAYRILGIAILLGWVMGHWQLF